MSRKNEPAYFPFLRPAGAALLVCAYLIASHLLGHATSRPGHQPVSVYLLAALLFICASMGAALLTHGRHLFDRVPVSQRWMALVPPRIVEERWTSELDGERPDAAMSQPRHDPVP